MKKSESIAKLATALNLAQSEMSGAKKQSSNPFFKSKYANLEEVIHCIKEPFADNGLSFVQFPISEDGSAGVETIIMHSSGEWISNEFMLKCAKNDPQGMGSAITYARRYGLQAAAGVPSEDDDGNAATRPPANKQAPPKAMTEAQKTNIMDLIAKADMDDARVTKGIEHVTAKRTSLMSQLYQPEAAKLISVITKIIQTEAKETAEKVDDPATATA